MTQKIKYCFDGRERFCFTLLLFILIGASAYIYTLNLSISENYKKERIDREARFLRQDMQSREEFLVIKLQEFYRENIALFVASNTAEPDFVVRIPSVAQASRNSKVQP